MTLIKTDIPLGYSVGTIVNGNTVMHMPNAQVVNIENLNLVNLNGEIFSGYIPIKNDYVKILEIFEDKLLVLVNHELNTDNWMIGYFKSDVLVNNVMIRENTIEWKNASIKNILDANGNIIYKLAATQIVQFLYETVDNNYACLLFNDNTGALKTGYVLFNEGIFYRYSELPLTLYPEKPKILNDFVSSSDQKNNFSKEILKVGDLTLNLKNLDILNVKDEIIFNSGYSNNLVNFIKLKEGFSENAYLDSTGHWTIGYGHLIIPGDGFNSQSVITETQAENLLINELNNLCYALKLNLKKSFPNFKFNYSYELDAILDLAYNNGLIVVSNKLEHSIFRDVLNKNYTNLQFDFCEWCHGDIDNNEMVIFGLYKRKLEDFIIFKTGLYINLPGNNMEELESALEFQSNFTNNIWY